MHEGLCVCIEPLCAIREAPPHRSPGLLCTEGRERVVGGAADQLRGAAGQAGCSGSSDALAMGGAMDLGAIVHRGAP